MWTKPGSDGKKRLAVNPALQEGKYFPKPNDYDMEYDYYWYVSQDGSRKLTGLGGVFNSVNMDVYHYAGLNPVKLVDPDGEDLIIAALQISFSASLGFNYQKGYILEFKNGIYELYKFDSINFSNGIAIAIGCSITYSTVNTIDEYKNQVISIGVGLCIVELGVSSDQNGEINIQGGIYKSTPLPIIEKLKLGLEINLLDQSLSNFNYEKITEKQEVVKILNCLKEKVRGYEIYENIITKALQYFIAKRDQDDN